MTKNYIVCYLTKVLVEDNSEGGAGGSEEEIILLSTAASDRPTDRSPQIQSLRVPYANWYGTKDGHDWLGWSNPAVGPTLASGKPWGIPICSFDESSTGDEIVVNLLFLGSDSFGAQDLANIHNRLAPGIARAIGSYYGGEAAGSSSEEITREIVTAIESFWPDDKLALHTNILRRRDDWGIGRDIETLEELDGRVRLTYRFERVVVETPIPIRVTLNRIHVPSDLDDLWDGASDVYVRSRVMNGYFVGNIPDQDLRRIPERGERAISSGRSWAMNEVIFDREVGPLLFIDVGIWDYDASTDDDMHGIVLGLWNVNELLTAFHANGWRPLQFQRVRRGSHLELDFTIEIMAPRLVSLFEWKSEQRSDSFVTSDERWRPRNANDHLRSPDYRFERVSGMIFNPDLPGLPGTIPLFSWYNNRLTDNLSSTDQAFSGHVGDTNDAGYYLFRKEGYVYDPNRPQPPGTVPLYRWSNADQDSRTTTDPAWAPSNQGQHHGWVFHRLEGYVITLF